MGRLLHLFDFNHWHNINMARKILAHKQHVDGLEAPRNSLELQVETSQSCAEEDLVIEGDWSKKSCYPIEASMKRLINEEFSQHRKNSPSIVARLMGVDMLPIDTKPVVDDRNRKNGNVGTKKSAKMAKNDVNRQVECDYGYKFGGKPRPREHPQEEELQKFKKEFEAWQAARFKECSKVVELCRSPDDDLFLAKENIYKQEMLGSREKKSMRNLKNSINSDEKFDKSLSSAPTRIVILKPGPDRFCDQDDSWTSSSCNLDDRDSIEDFLEEVKERLKCELQGKTVQRSCSVVRGSGIETPFSEKPLTDPKQIAKHIAKHVRESVTRDIEMNLLRSESTRSYRSENIQFNGPNSPEFMHRDTRRFLPGRLRNAHKRESHSLEDIPLVEPGILSSHFDIAKDEPEMQTRSFRHLENGNGMLHKEESPRNLVRSLSAPVSGTSFGKLLLEDRHILTGAHIRRKHEALENITMELKKRKKERFNIKEKVSNFKHSFTLRGRVFAKKLQAMVESHGFEQEFSKDITSGPTIMRNLSERLVMENSTEVPPSPASVCSSMQEDLWRPVEYSSPDIAPVDDSSMPQVFKEISSNLNELRRQLSRLESNEPEDTVEEEPNECIMVDELKDKTEIYIKDLLVASGLYDGSCEKLLSRWDPLGKPIPNWVFETVEKSYNKVAKETETNAKEHKMLYDLLNEALSTELGPPTTMSRFKRKIISSSPLCGRKLLNCAMEVIRTYLNSAEDDKSYQTLDSLVAMYLESTPWSGLIDEELNGLGKEMESMIVKDLIGEVVNDIWLN